MSTHVLLRIGFADAGREDVHVFQSRVRVGLSADNDVVVASPGVADRHLQIVNTPCGWVLEIMAGAERVHVNARPVRERALLRMGDVISLGTCRLMLKQPTDDIAPPRFTPGRQGNTNAKPAHAGLRGLSGIMSGRFLGIDPELQLDKLSLPGCVGCLRLRAGRNAVNFAFVDATLAEQAFCNGVLVSRGRLQAGDQLVWGRHRFVLEMSAPLLLATQSPAAHEGNEGADKRTPHKEICWLLAAAAVLAMGIALSLLLSS